MPVKRPAEKLRLLIASFNGHPPHDSDWPEIIKIANRGWLVPALYVALRDKECLHQLASPVRDYLELLHDRNLDRNRRLRVQLIEAIAALNENGISPVLLKGCIRLFTVHDASLGARMLSDLDIHVEPLEMERAKSALAKLGYRSGAISRELGRPQDVGEIELHDRPSRRSVAYLSGDLRTTTTLVETDGAVAGVPDPTSQALHLIVHDMIKEGDYWRLRMDLRHLHDLANLASAPPGIDWGRLRAALSFDCGRCALELQTRALADLYEIRVPADLIGGKRSKMKHAARLAATEQTLSGLASRTTGKILWGLHRLTDDYSSKGAANLMQRAYGVLVRPATGSRL